MTTYTVEKIGGTSMSAFDTVLDNILLRPATEGSLYNRVFVVSAYGGLTDSLLECKRTGKPGVYSLVASGDERWINELDTVEQRMLLTNDHMFADPMDRMAADKFIRSRASEARRCIMHLLEVCQYGQFDLSNYLPEIREFLASLGEVHSAYNTALKLKSMGINATFVDLSLWDAETLPESLEQAISQAFEKIDIKTELPIVTGYAASKQGVMSLYDRGYSEMTFSRLASVTNADLAIIHKEYHLSSADPRVVGAESVKPVGETNFDVADQLASLGMEAIHPRAAACLRESGIELQIKNTFEPDHDGTLISEHYTSDDESVEIVAGKAKVHALQLFDQSHACHIDKVSLDLMTIIEPMTLEVISKEMTANSLTYYLCGSASTIDKVKQRLKKNYPEAQVSCQVVSMVSAIGTRIDSTETLSIGTRALAEAGISPVALHAPVRNVSVQYVVEEGEYQQALGVVHQALCEPERDACGLKGVA
ncbi:aspartate kinase [Vibrio maritimus]|uniref:aspartate kinase n=1 Tax=Vibrio maritimus TaxID=990268 RepID=UPI0037369E12